MEFKIRGLIAPVFTPFKKNGDLNLDIIDTYAKHLLKDNNLDGILVNGTSGEGMSMNLQERKIVSQAWIKAINKTTHVMIQVGGASFPDVLELAKHAEQFGADSLLCLPDLYMKPKTVQDLIGYLKLVSAAAPNTPLLYYHIPMFTNVNIHMGVFLREVKDSIPTFAGIKFTSNDLDEGYEAMVHGKFALFLGADTLILSAFELGFDSSISTTLNFYANKAKLIIGPNVARDRRQMEQLSLNRRIKAITKFGGWVPTMKAAMNILSPFDCGPVRPPMQSLTEQQIKELKLSMSSIDTQENKL